MAFDRNLEDKNSDYKTLKTNSSWTVYSSPPSQLEKSSQDLSVPSEIKELVQKLSQVNTVNRVRAVAPIAVIERTLFEESPTLPPDILKNDRVNFNITSNEQKLLPPELTRRVEKLRLSDIRSGSILSVFPPIALIWPPYHTIKR